MIPRCSVAQDHKIVTTPLQHFDYPSGNPAITDEFRIEHANKLEAFKCIFREVGEDPLQGLAIEVGEDPLQGLAMIDAIQRLGIDHHFQYEIEKVLQKQYILSCTNGGHDYDLHEVALRFRLLRQEGVFNRFKDRKGSFRHELGRDIKGLMELYEASQLGIDGEDFLDEAREFSSQILKKWGTAEVDHFSGKAIRNTLGHHLYHKSITTGSFDQIFSHMH
ncbi:hypothetical protein CRYUN_Cryun31cG0020800 [Craigia yunnanensis]